jgi:hypothetical protein
VPVLSDGRLGDDSLEGLGELAADGVRFGSSFLVGGIEDVEVSRGLCGFCGFCGVLTAAWSLGGVAVMSTGSAVSWAAAVMGVKCLSSMAVAVGLGV